MIDKNYYNILGLNPTCALKDIKKSYHKLALTWHPDKHSDKTEAQSKFTEINEAYTILADNKKRMIYDTCGQAGLDMDQDLRDFAADCGKGNFFYEKGYYGSNKSAFDVLRDIFEESDEDDEFFEDCALFDLADDFKTNIKSFIEENIMASETEEGDTFFKNYTPTFMDADFFCEPPSLFETIIPDGDCQTQTEFFTFFSADMPSFSKKSTNNKKSRTSNKQKMQKATPIYEDEEYEIFELGPKTSKKSKNSKNKYTTEEIIIEEEDFVEFLGKGKNSQKKSKKQAKNSQQGCHLGARVHSELDFGDDDLNEVEATYNKKSQKKNKNKM